MSKNISTQYYLQQKFSHGSQITIDKNSNKQYIISMFNDFCERHPKNKFLVVKKETIHETIVESDDYRQLKMCFV